jgi:hypothetical protein
VTAAVKSGMTKDKHTTMRQKALPYNDSANKNTPPAADGYRDLRDSLRKDDEDKHTCIR